MNTENKPSIIIGNGFNLALNDLNNTININLDYENIRNKVLELLDEDKSGDNAKLKQYLNQDKIDESERINDLEKLLKILQDSINCIKFENDIYTKPIENNYSNILQSDIKRLKKYVIKALTHSNIHPDYNSIFGNEINKPYISNCAENLGEYQKIYTINYDLILYWLLANQNLFDKFKDGFTPNQALKPTEQSDNLLGFSTNNNLISLFYLHGALHLLKKGIHTYKIRRDDNNNLDLQKIKNQLLKTYNDFDNLIVFDATSKHKLDAIFGCDYLIKAYDKLLTLSGTVVVYGCKMYENDDNNNDEHLWSRLINSNISNIYVGRHDCSDLNQEAENLSDHLAKLKHTNQDIKIRCFSTNKINIWGNEKFHTNIVDNCSKSYTIPKK